VEKRGGACCPSPHDKQHTYLSQVHTATITTERKLGSLEQTPPPERIEGPKTKGKTKKVETRAKENLDAKFSPDPAGERDPLS